MKLIQELVAPKSYNLCCLQWMLVSGKEEGISRIGSELNVSLEMGLERLNVIYCQEGGRGKRVLVSRRHKNKRSCEVLTGYNNDSISNFHKNDIF